MSVPYDDRGLLLGDGLFETVLAKDGRLILMEAHGRRLREGARVLGLPEPDLAALVDVGATALRDAGLETDRAAVRITLTSGSGGRGLDRPDQARPRLFATAAASPSTPAPAALAFAEVRRNAQSPASRLKTLAYLDNVIARRQALAQGADEAILLNTAGKLACAAAANLFWVVEDRLFTPAIDCGVLPGVIRAQVLARAGQCGLRAEEVAVGREALDRADAVFLTNSLVGLRPVNRIGAKTYEGSGAAARLAAALGEFV
jgi:branched-subunit amino acid aminotransferase/4-amino-4-deoxychorismate lyase